MRKGNNICLYPQVKTNGPCGKPCVNLYCKDHIKCHRKNMRLPVACNICGLYCNSHLGLCITCKQKKTKQLPQNLCNECGNYHILSDFTAKDVLADDYIKKNGLCSKTPVFTRFTCRDKKLCHVLM